MADRWDIRFAGDEFWYGEEPNEWIRTAVGEYLLCGKRLAERGHALPDELTAIELAAGEGRNALWLAAQGLQVTAIDRSEVGLAKASHRAAELGLLIDSRVDDAIAFGLESDGWRDVADVVVSTFFHVPAHQKGDLFRAHRALVKPGGLLIAEWFHPDQAERKMPSGGPGDPTMLITPAELRAAFVGWHVYVCRRFETTLDEGPGHQGAGIVTRIAAERPLARV